MEMLLKRLLFFLVTLRCLITSADAQASNSTGKFNITQVLAPHSQFSLFNQWLSATGVADEVNNRSSLTVLVTPNAVLQPYLSIAQQSNITAIADALRYQVLLTYFGWPELQKIPRGNFSQITTLLQTTGRYNTTQGFVDIYNNGSNYIIGHFKPDSYGNKTIQGNITQELYVYSVLQVDGLLLPVPENGLVPSPAPVSVPAGAPGSVNGTAPGIASPGSPKVSPSSTTVGSYANVHSANTPLVFGALFLASAIIRLS